MAYIFYDGDNIGEKFAALYRTGNLARLRLLSSSLADVHLEIDGICMLSDARLIEYGGDEGLIEAEKSLDELCENIRGIWKSFGLTATVGLGDTPGEAFNAVCKLKDAMP